jgi:hypothetical protein
MIRRGAVGWPIHAATVLSAALTRFAGLLHVCALLALLLAPAAHAQFNLFLVEGSTERAAPAVYDFGSLYPGESASVHFRVRNVSNAAATVTVLEVAGVGFTLTTSPTLPVGLAPQDAVDLTVVFGATDTGAYSASLHSDGIAILLTATLAPRLTYRLDVPGAPFPGPVDFGSAVAGSAAQRGITFRNETSLILTVPSISVQGTDFALLAAAPAGEALQPGQGGEIAIVFAPQTTGARQGSLIIGDRTYPLLGTGIDPPLPKPTVTIDLKQTASGQQGTLIVRFDAPARSRGTGTATLDFQGAADSAIVFASGGRSATFAIAPGDVQAALPFETGTTAGLLTFTAQVGVVIDRQSVTIAAVAPVISAVQAVRSSGAVEILVTGFDNTRSVGALSFTFYDTAGNLLSPGTIRADALADFTSYFAASNLGGVFLLRAVFPVTGDATLVASCEATLANSAGSVKTQRAYF